MDGAARDDLTGVPLVDAPSPRRPSRTGKVVRALVSTLVVVAIFGFFFPQIADYGAVWDTIAAMTWLELASLVTVAAWNIASYWPLIVAVQPGLRLREGAVANLASTAIANTVPGGAALGVGATLTMQRSWGIPVADTALAMLVAGVWNNFIKLGLPVVALALLALEGDATTVLVLAALIGVVVLVAAVAVFVLLLRSGPMAARVGHALGRVASMFRRMLHRGPVEGWDQRAVHFRAEIIELLRHRWVLITVTALFSHLSLYIVLLVALRHVGVSNEEVSWAAVLAAFAFVRLLSAVPVTPGGLGLVELGLTAALGSGLPDSTKNQIAAAVLVYRALTWLLPVPLGVGCWLFWRANRSWRQTIEQRAATRPATASAPILERR